MLQAKNQNWKKEIVNLWENCESQNSQKVAFGS